MNFHLAKLPISFPTTFNEVKESNMIIYHLFINGKFRFKTNSFLECYQTFEELDHSDNVISQLIDKHEYHLYDFSGRRVIDIVVSTVGE